MHNDCMKKIVLISGASRGIGYATAHLMLNNGYEVIGTATTEDGAERISNLCVADRHAHGYVLNLVDRSQAQSVFDRIKKNHGPIEILVNNAGITRDNIAMRMSEQDWDELIDTNLSAAFRFSKLCLRDMMKKRWGRIISVSSVIGATGNAGQVNYAASKAGLDGFTKSLAQEVGSRGITVNNVAPGFIKTDMTAQLLPQQSEQILSAIPLSRFGESSDVAQLIGWLASDHASYITGQTIHVNGGLFMS